MKRLLVCLSLLASTANASPYFRLLDLSRPQINAGYFMDPNKGTGTGGAMLAVVTHSPKDGCLLPSITCESWTPLAIGGSFLGSERFLAIGPSVNLAPIVKAGLRYALNAATRGDSYTNLKELLSEPENAEHDLSAAFGPQFVLAPDQRWKGYFRLFVGGAWSFGR